jgi:hypothetical protein
MTLWSKSPPRYEGLGKRWAEEHEAAISANLASPLGYARCRVVGHSSIEVARKGALNTTKW